MQWDGENIAVGLLSRNGVGGWAPGSTDGGTECENADATEINNAQKYTTVGGRSVRGERDRGGHGKKERKSFGDGERRSEAREILDARATVEVGQVLDVVASRLRGGGGRAKTPVPN